MHTDPRPDVPAAVVAKNRGRLGPSRRRLLVVFASLAIAAGGWQLAKRVFHVDLWGTSDLEARQSNARKAVGPALDALFEQQLDVRSNTLRLDADLAFSDDLGAYGGLGCAKGFDAAFADALGPDVVRVTDASSYGRTAPRLRVTGTVARGDSTFQLRNSTEPYPGLVMTIEMTLVGKHVRAVVASPQHIDFEVLRSTGAVRLLEPKPITRAEVEGAIMEGTCREAGYALLEGLTTWKRPSPPPAPDPARACEDGFHCREAGEALEASDPERAVLMYARGCDSSKDDESCLLAATLAQTTGYVDYDASMRVEFGCQGRRVLPCFAAGLMTLIPSRPGKRVTGEDRGKALAYLLRACDRGLHEACNAAAPLLHKTPFAAAGHVLLAGRPARSKQLGTIFALKWGQWTERDRGQATAWVTERPPRPPRDALVTEFARADVPAGINVPEGAETVYAIALDAGDGDYDRACAVCSPDATGEGLFAMGSSSCVCALTPVK